MNTKLLMGYFSGWSQCNSGKSSILIFGESQNAIQQLQDIFIKLATGEVEEVALHTASFIEPLGAIDVMARRSDVDRGMQRIESGNSFRWETTARFWGHFAREVAVFRDDYPYGQHQYLDTEVLDALDVEVSFCQYSREWIKQAHASYNAREVENS